jgi:hypothetical protein
MTYAAPSFDFYDDGLVHSHDWSRSTPPGQRHPNQKHKDAQRSTSPRAAREHDEARMSGAD